MTYTEALNELTPQTKKSILDSLYEQGLVIGSPDYLKELETQVWDEYNNQ